MALRGIALGAALRGIALSTALRSASPSAAARAAIFVFTTLAVLAAQPALAAAPAPAASATAFELPAKCRDLPPLTDAERRTPVVALRHRVDTVGEQDPAEGLRLMCGTIPRIAREDGPRSLELARWVQMLATPLIAYYEQFDDATALLAFARPILEKELGEASPEVAELHVASAWMAFRRGLLADAGAAWERALRVRERTPGPRRIELQKVLVGLAQVRLAQRDWPAARRALDRAHAILLENGTAVSEAGAAIENAYGNLEIRQEDYAAARRHVEAQVTIETELARRAGPGQDVPQPVTALVTLGTVLERLDEYDEAERALREAVRLAESKDGPPQRQYLPAYTQLAILLGARGRPVEAVTHARRAVEVGEATIGPDSPRMVRVLHALAEAHRALGELPESLRAYQRADAIVQRHRTDVERQTLVAHYQGFANLWLALGDLDQAGLALDAALAAAGSEPTLATERAASLLAQGRLGMRREAAAARASLEAALSLYRERLPDTHPTILRVINELCALEVHDGAARATNCDDAAARLQGTRELDPALRAGVYENRSLLAERRADAGAAYESAVLAAAAAASFGMPDPLWRAQFQLARQLHARAEMPLAIFFGKQAIVQIERLRAGVQGEYARLERGFLVDKVAVYRAVADWLMEAGRIDEALDVLALLKAEELSGFVVRAAPGRPDGVALTGDERRLLDAYARVVAGEAGAGAGATAGAAGGAAAGATSGAAGGAASGVATGAESARLAALGESGRLTRAERARLAALLEAQRTAEAGRADRIREFIAGSAQRAPAAAPRARAIQAERLDRAVRRFGPQSALAVYLLTEDRLRILVATQRGQSEFVVPVDGTLLRRDIGRLLDGIARREDTLPAARALYAKLLAPVASVAARDGARRIVLWPDGALRYVPFAALHDGRGYAIEHFTLQLYAGSQADEVGREEAGRERADRPASSLSVRGLGVTRAVAGYDALPGMADELCYVVRGPIEGLATPAGACPSPQAASGALQGAGYADTAFTERRLTTLLDGRREFSVLHLGTHFSLRPGNAMRSFLVLGDGSRLTLDRIAALDFGGLELVTLSACQTGLAGAVGDDGREIEGLSSIVQRRGASRVVSSLWHVEDASTARLMRVLYAQLAKAGGDAGGALRRAQLELLRSKAGDGRSYAHPYYWAGFAISGSAR